MQAVLESDGKGSHMNNTQAQHVFIATLHNMVGYWLGLELTQGDGIDDDGCLQSDLPIDRQRVEGMVHTILCIMDGVAGFCDREVVVKAMEGPEMLHDMFHAEEAKRNEARRATLEKEPGS